MYRVLAVTLSAGLLAASSVAAVQAQQGRSASETTLQGGVSAVSGGVGLNARHSLASQAHPNHNVKMVFSLTTGNYLANVDVNVRNAQGNTVLEGVSDGPWLYAKLPPGKYTATATYNGHATTQRFSVGRSGERVAYFRWPASVEQNVVSGVSPILGTGPQRSR